MKFPKWVNGPRSTRQDRASNRLRYLILRLALELDRDNTLQKVAAKVGVSHSVISLYITRGQFSSSLATKFEDTFGRDLCPNEWLRNPLSIPVSK